MSALRRHRGVSGSCPKHAPHGPQPIPLIDAGLAGPNANTAQGQASSSSAVSSQAASNRSRSAAWAASSVCSSRSRA